MKKKNNTGTQSIFKAGHSILLMQCNGKCEHSLTLTVPMVRCGAIALVTGTHVGAFKVGAGTVSADLWLQALVHILQDVV